MTGKELFGIMAEKKMPPRIPFIPTIYEHAAKVINKTPSQVAQSTQLLVESQLKCYELYKHDLISVGIDIYNIELEALGGEVIYSDGPELPAIETILIKSKEDFKKLAVPNPHIDGRMPMYIDAVDQINKAVGHEVIVNGAIVGPFTLAAMLRGFENFIMDVMFDYDFAYDLMMFSKEVGLTFAKALCDIGVSVSINESWIAPPLLTPDIYNEKIYLIQKEMIDDLRRMGMKNVALISGGDTTLIAESMIKTGTSLLLADYNADHIRYKELCKAHDVSVRASIEAQVVEEGIYDSMYEATQSVINNCKDYYRFIFGCGIVSYDTPVENVLRLKEIVNGFGDR